MPRAKHLEFISEDYQHLPNSDIIGNSSDQSHIYYNVQIFNNSTNYDISGNPIPTVLAVPADFNQQRSKAYINKPSSYFVTVPYFTLDSNSFPIQIVQPVVNSSYTVIPPIIDTGLEGFPTIFEIYMEVHDGPNVLAVYRQQILWKPLDQTIIQPISPIKQEDIQNEYFWNYSYDYFLDLLNNTISYTIDYFGYINTPSYGKPFFYYDPQTELIHYVASLPFMNDISGDDIYTSKYTYKLYVNESLYKLLQSTLSIFGESPYNGYQILAIPNPGNTNIITINDTIGGGGLDIKYIDMIQEFPSALLWNPVVSVIFTTPNLTVCNELIARPLVYGYTPVTYPNNNESLNILYEHLLDKRADPVIKNFAKSEYRLVDLFSIQPMYQLIIETYWKDTFGILHRFYIEQGSGFAMKILFRKTKYNSKK